MADIVQLKENGVAKFLKTHVKAVEGYSEDRTNLKNELKLKNKDVWTGASYFDEALSINYKPNNENVVFVELGFSRYVPGDGEKSYGYLNYLFSKEARKNSGSFYLPFVNIDQAISIKSVSFDSADTKVSGNEYNKTNVPSKNFVLRKVAIWYV